MGNSSSSSSPPSSSTYASTSESIHGKQLGGVRDRMDRKAALRQQKRGDVYTRVNMKDIQDGLSRQAKQDQQPSNNRQFRKRDLHRTKDFARRKSQRAQQKESITNQWEHFRSSNVIANENYDDVSTTASSSSLSWHETPSNNVAQTQQTKSSSNQSSWMSCFCCV